MQSMPHISIDPSSQMCLDYTLEVFKQTWLPLVNDATTHKQAATLLTNLWTTGNATKELLWQAQLDADNLVAQNTQQLVTEDEALREVEALREKEDLHKEECKKNHSKFLPIPDHPVPQRPLVITTQSATHQMDKGEFVPLWYYTNKGLESTLSTYSSTDINALTLLHHPNSSTSLISTSSFKESKGIIEDHNLKWEEFCIATPRMVDAMSQAN